VHGSVSALVDEAGSVSASYGYDAYGEKDTGLSGGDPEDTNPLNPYRYSARRFDSGSATIDMGARRFGPDVARFLQPDLFIGSLANLGLSTDVLTGNRYALAAGNPLSFVEWDGHHPINDSWGGRAPTPKPADEPEDEDGGMTGPLAFFGGVTFGITKAVGSAVSSIKDVGVGFARTAVDTARTGLSVGLWGLRCYGFHQLNECAEGVTAAGRGAVEVVQHPSLLFQSCLDAIHRGHGGECVGEVAFDIAFLKGMRAFGLGLRAGPSEVASSRLSPLATRAAGTVDEWWSVSNVSGFRAGTLVPESFDLTVAGQKFAVVPNATKHLAEYATSMGSGSVPISSLAGSVETALQQGLVYGRNFLRIGAWELGIDTRANVIYHAVYRP
jgi:RHS repeat-associated protein